MNGNGWAEQRTCVQLLCHLPLQRSSTGCGFGAVPDTILRFSARNLEAWSYTSIKTKLGMFESSQYSRITTSLAFVLRINGRGIRLQWRPCVPLSIWLRSTAQPSIHSAEENWSRPWLATSKRLGHPESRWLWKQATTQTLKTESRCMPYKVKKLLTATACKSVVWKITQHTGLNNKDFISVCPVRPVVDFYLPWQCFHWIYHLFIFIFKSLNVPFRVYNYNCRVLIKSLETIIFFFCSKIQ